MSETSDFFYDNSYEFDKITNKNAYDQAMTINSFAKAQVYLKYLATEILKDRSDISFEEAREIARRNIGYYAAYNTDEIRIQVERVFNTEHPILGKCEEMGHISAEEAFNCGRLGMTLKEYREHVKNNPMNTDEIRRIVEH
jgi:hypothetical protein